MYSIVCCLCVLNRNVKICACSIVISSDLDDAIGNEKTCKIGMARHYTIFTIPRNIIMKNRIANFIYIHAT